MSNKGTFMLRKNIALLLSILTLLSALSVIPMTATAKSVDSAETGANIDVAETGWTIPTEVNFASRLATLKKKYYPRGYSGAYYEDGYAMAWQCYGYACQMLKEVFGIKYYADGFVNRADYTMGNLNAGDIVRIRGNTHSIFITKVTSKGYYFTDANWDYNNGVRWDAYYTKAEMAATFTYKIHVPGSNLQGTGTAKTGLYAPIPAPVSATPTGAGIEVRWNAVPDVAGYRVFYKAGTDTSWKTAGNAKTTTYLFNKELVYGKEYTFTIRALDSYGTIVSDYNKTGISTEYRVSPPDLTSVNATVGNIAVKWSAVKGVSYYRLFYRTPADTHWHKLTDVKGTSYNFTKGSPYTTYRFTLVCLDNKKQVIGNSCAKTLAARFMTYDTQLEIPTNVKPAANKTLGRIQVTWDAVPGAKKYVVFVSKNGATSGWKKIGTTTRTYFYHSGCKNHTLYRYTVRCVDTKDKFISGFKAGSVLHYFDYPTKLNATKKDDNGNIIVSWTGIKNAPAYAIFYKEGDDTAWKRLNTKPVYGTSTTFTGAKDGVDYTFTVRVCDKKMINLSSYSDKGVGITYTVTPPATEPIVLVPTGDATEAQTDPATEDPTEASTQSPTEEPATVPATEPIPG